MPGPDAAGAAPDQTALMFWTDQATYHDGFNTVAVRAYTNLHGGAYGPPSRADFPVLLDGGPELDQPYYLIDQPADWMLARVSHFIGAPKDPASGLKALSDWAVAIRTSQAPSMVGAIGCAGDGYVVAWVAEDAALATAAAPESLFAELVTATDMVLCTETEHCELEFGLWDDCPAGIDLGHGSSSLNIQLNRPPT